MELPTDKIISCFYESSGDCIKVLDTAGSIMSFNPAGLKVMEIDSLQDVLGSKWLEFWKDEMKEKANEAFQQALAGKMGYFEGYCPTFKGTPKWWQVNIAPLHNEFNQVQWILSISRDVTQWHMLKEENAKLKLQVSQMTA